MDFTALSLSILINRFFSWQRRFLVLFAGLRALKCFCCVKGRLDLLPLGSQVVALKLYFGKLNVK